MGATTFLPQPKGAEEVICVTLSELIHFNEHKM